MKSVLLIGLGRFGRQMAEKLRELRHQILAVDRDEGRVNDILPLVTNAQIGMAPTRPSLPPWGCGTLTCAWWPLGITFKAPWRPRPS